MSKASERNKREFKRAEKKLKRLSKNLDKRLPSGLRMIGEDIMLDVKASRPGAGVPVDKGPLRASGRVESIGSEVHLSFGGVAGAYALIQHEEMSFRHTVGEPRYLVRGVERWQPNGVSGRRALHELQLAVDDAAKGRESIGISLASSHSGAFSSA